MVDKVAKVARTWLASISFILSVGAIVIALSLNAQQNAQTERNLAAARHSRCLDAREGKARQLKVVQILVDLDAADGHTGNGTLEFQRRVIKEYRVLRACAQLGLSSEIPHKENP